MPTEKFAFIGQMHRFDEDLALLCRRLGMSERIVKQNATPTRSHADDNLRALFEKANPAELEHYNRFVERAEEISSVRK